MKDLYKILIAIVICVIIILISIFLHNKIMNSQDIINTTVKSIILSFNY